MQLELWVRCSNPDRQLPFAGLTMHPYVCLAILGACKEELMETEQPELQARLQRLPALDIDMIITQAYHCQCDQCSHTYASPFCDSAGIQYSRDL